MDSKKKRVTISWSGGKDATFALFKIMASGAYEVVHLHTLFNSDTGRVGLHGVAQSIIQRQADCIGLPLIKLYTPSAPDHGAYAACMRAFYAECDAQGIEGIVFGDIFLEDLRRYRLSLLEGTRLTPEFPLWQIDSHTLIHDFIDVGFKTLVCSANAALLDKAALGKTIDDTFVSSLQAGVDVCGENGEFHTLAYDGPIFRKPLALRRGDVIQQHYKYNKVLDNGTTVSEESTYWFQDLTLAD